MTLGTLGKCSVVMMVVRGGRQRTHTRVSRHGCDVLTQVLWWIPQVPIRLTAAMSHTDH